MCGLVMGADIIFMSRLDEVVESGPVRADDWAVEPITTSMNQNKEITYAMEILFGFYLNISISVSIVANVFGENTKYVFLFF